MSQSDEILINELKKYGEVITVKITDKNRDIYIKKLNHYKARQKLEENPSKYAKQVNMNSTKLKSKTNTTTTTTTTGRSYINDDNDDDNYEQHDDNGVYESAYDTSEYVHVNNAYTSPLSNSIESRLSNGNHTNGKRRGLIMPDCYIIEDDSSAPRSSQPQQSTVKPTTQIGDVLNYKRTKEKIDLERTLQKYRNEISEILDTNKIRSRVSVAGNNTINSSSISILNSDTLPHNRYKSMLTSTLISEQQPSHQQQQQKSDNVTNNQRTNETNQLFSSRRPLNANKTQNTSKLNEKINQFKDKTLNLGIKVSKYLPYFILAIFSVFLILYLRMKINANNTSLFNMFNFKSSSHEMHCDDIKDAKCAQTRVIVREIINYLRARSGNVECKQLEPAKKFAHNDDLYALLVKKNLIRPDNHLKPINTAYTAILKHPHWNIRFLNSTYYETQNVDDITYAISDISTKSLTCRINETLQTMSINLLIIILTIFIGFAIFMLSKMLFKYYQHSQKQFFDLLSQVVAIVEKQHELSLSNENVKPYIALSHVYDTIIAHSERKSQKSLWNKIVKFINDHESRIRVETQYIDGEETLVWRWIVPVTTANLISTSINSQLVMPPLTTTIVQQPLSTPATATSLASSVVSPVVPITNTHSQSNNTQGNWQNDDRLLTAPTPCLKIRFMFDQANIDKDPFFFNKIYNDVLHKCANVNSIVHIQGDRKSKEGCVYVKCSNNDAAGKAYQLLNGIIYNNKQLNVKFLRNDRYLERFPESANCTQPLKAN